MEAKQKHADAIRKYCEAYGTWKTARRLTNLRVKSMTGMSLEEFSDTSCMMSAVENINDAVESFMNDGDMTPIDQSIDEITIEFLYSNLLS